MKLRSTKDVINDIKSLVNRTGFIYTLCLILIEDFHLNAEEMHQIDIRSRLNKNEISLLLGFLIQKEISFDKPKSPFDLIQLKKESRELMDELHKSTLIPSIEKFKPLVEQLDETNDFRPTKKELFEGEDMFIEPIFYSGDGIYDFQYLEYLEKKYKYDENWLIENSNFKFEEVIEIANKIKSIHKEKFDKVHFLSLQESKDKIRQKLKKNKSFSNKQLNENFDEILSIIEFYQFVELFGSETELVDKLTKKEVSEKGWNSFYNGLLDIFCFNKKISMTNLKYLISLKISQSLSIQLTEIHIFKT